MMSQPASACTSACLTSTATVSSLRISPSRMQAVMAVAGEGIERDVGQEADLRHFLLDGAHGAADQIVRVERFAAGLVAQVRVGIGKQREAGDGQLGGAFGLAHRLVDRQPLDAGHRGHWRARVVAVHDEQRPDQVVGGELVLAHHAARPFAAPVAAQADGEIEAFGTRRSLSTGARRLRASMGRPNLIAIGVSGRLFLAGPASARYPPCHD